MWMLMFGCLTRKAVVFFRKGGGATAKSMLLDVSYTLW